MNSLIFTVTVVGILAFNVLLGVWRKRKLSQDFSITTYAADPNKNREIIISLSLLGTIVGGGMFLAVGQIGYEARYVGIILGLVYIVGLGTAGIVSRRIRKLMKRVECYTLLDFLSVRYDKKTVVQFSLINFLMYLFLLASQFVAMYDFLSFVEGKIENQIVPYALVGLAILALFTYPIIGGIRKDIQTDIIQILVILIATFFLSYQIFDNNVIASVFKNDLFKKPAETEYGLIFIIGAVLFLTPSFFVRMDIWQRINTAKSSKDSMYGFIIAGFISFLFFSIFTIIGSYANVLGYENSQFATLNTIYALFDNSIVLAFVVGGFFVAVLSSADTLINNVSLFATKLIFPKVNFSNNSSDFDLKNNLLVKSRIAAFILTLAALVLSLIVPDIVDLLIGAFSLLLIFLPTIIGLLSEKRSSNAAFYSVFISFALFLILFFFWNPTMAFVPVVFLSFIIYYPYQYFENRFA